MARSLRLLLDQAAQRRRLMQSHADELARQKREGVGVFDARFEIGARVVDLESGEDGDVIDVQRVDVESAAAESRDD